MKNLQISHPELEIIKTALWELLERDPISPATRALFTKLSLVRLREIPRGEKETPAARAGADVGPDSFPSLRAWHETPAPVPAPALFLAMAAALATPVLSAADRRLLDDLKVTW